MSLFLSHFGAAWFFFAVILSLLPSEKATCDPESCRDVGCLRTGLWPCLGCWNIKAFSITACFFFAIQVEKSKGKRTRENLPRFHFCRLDRGSQSKSTLTRVVRKSPGGGLVLASVSKIILRLGSVTVRKFCRSDETNFCKQTQNQKKTSGFSFNLWWKHEVFWKTFVLLYSFGFSTWTEKRLKLHLTWRFQLMYSSLPQYLGKCLSNTAAEVQVQNKLWDFLFFGNSHITWLTLSVNCSD